MIVNEISLVIQNIKIEFQLYKCHTANHPTLKRRWKDTENMCLKETKMFIQMKSHTVDWQSNSHPVNDHPGWTSN